MSKPCVQSQQNAVVDAAPLAMGFDPTFNAGQVVTSFPSSTGVSQIYILPNGNIRAAGISGNQITMAEYLSNGQPSIGFGTGGQLSVSFSFSVEQIAFQSTGALIVAGIEPNHSNGNIVVERLNLSGQIDHSFGMGGAATTVFSQSGPFQLGAASVGANDQISVVGTATTAYDATFYQLPFSVPVVTTTEILFFNTDSSGHPNTLFANDGSLDVAGEDAVLLMADINAAWLGSDGSLYFAGDSYDTDGDQATVARLTPFGILDPTFGSPLRARSSFSSGRSTAQALAIDPSLNVVITGSEFDDGQYNLILSRFSSAGTHDSTFGTAGQVLISDPTGSDLIGQSVMVLPNGNILVGGKWQGATASTSLTDSMCVSLPTNITQTSALLYRFLPSGALDTSFGQNGQLVFSYGGTIATVSTLQLETPPGAAAGDFLVGGQTDGAFAISRLLP